MRVRELRLRNVRNFGEPRMIRFDDLATGLVRPLSVIVGSNGSGKSSVLEVLHGLLASALDTGAEPPIMDEVRASGYATICLEFDANAPPPLQTGLSITLGRNEHDASSGHGPILRPDVRRSLNAWALSMQDGRTALRDGLLFIPHERSIKYPKNGAIEPAPTGSPWNYRFAAADKWRGSLSQFWVWQNYLDLERQDAGRPRLTSFVEAVEELLGDGQTIFIHEGRVHIKRPRLSDTVELHQLPSGQQQILTLFGEIIRRIRPGGVLLIDEVELSLHPALQRAVIGHLRRLAASHDLQVIVTTHSLEIVAAVAPHEVINLDSMVADETADEAGHGR